jgi:F420-non-reducing hydrogenase iron-sulfur subunit
MTIKRITFLQELLAFMGLGGRLHLEWISSAEAQKFVQVVTDFTEKIKALGPNPIKALQQTAPPRPKKPVSALAGKIDPAIPAEEMMPVVEAAH